MRLGAIKRQRDGPKYLAGRRPEIGRGGFDITIDPRKTAPGGDNIERSRHEDLGHHDGNGGEPNRDPTLGKPLPDQSISTEGHEQGDPRYRRRQHDRQIDKSFDGGGSREATPRQQVGEWRPQGDDDDHRHRRRCHAQPERLTQGVVRPRVPGSSGAKCADNQRADRNGQEQEEKSASAQTVISLARLPGPVVVLPSNGGCGRASRHDLRRIARHIARAQLRAPKLRIVGSPVDSTINDLILTPLLLYGLEPVTLEHSLTFFAEKVGRRMRSQAPHHLPARTATG